MQTRPAEAERRIDQRATRLIEGIRAQAGGLGGIEDFLHAYSLSTKEGLGADGAGGGAAAGARLPPPPTG